MKIDLREHPKIEQLRRTDNRTLLVPWKQAAPFVMNPRGILIHRAWSVTTFIRHYSNDDTNIVVKYACWNGCSFDCEVSDLYLLHEVPNGRLLCERCEVVAVYNGFPSADELCGRHVHRGHLRAVRTCCKELEN